MEQLIGQSIGDRIQSDLPDRYQIQTLLGKQPGRRTFLAQDSQTGSLVVIKLILFGPDFTWEDLKLFEREAETLKSLDHAAIPRYLDSFEVETSLGQGFALVQTYIKAKSLQDWVSSGYTFSERDLRGIASGLLRILEYLHCRQPPVIHRDIKPSNILLPDQDSQAPEGIYLVDFGSVQTAQTNGTITIVGTYGYMPPEQFGGRALPASDIYSLGATLIYLATGKHPSELMQADMQLEFDNTSVSEQLSHWLQQLTYADLARRTSSAPLALKELQQSPAKNKEVSHPAAISQGSSTILKSTFADLTVTTTPTDLVIELAESRLISRELISRENATTNKNSLGEMTPKSFLLWTAFSTGTLAFQHFLIAPLAALIPPDLRALASIVIFTTVFVSAFVANHFIEKDRNKSKFCLIRLSAEPKSSVMVSLSRLIKNNDTGWIQTKTGQSEKIFSSDMLLLFVSASPGIFKDKVVITMSLNQHQQNRKLEICGKRQEMKWLCEHITRWGKCEIKSSLP